MYEFFKNRISLQYPLDDTPVDHWQETAQQHESYMKNRSVNVFGREDEMERMMRYILQGSDVPMLVVGEVLFLFRTLNSAIKNVL